ncbi:hypothetical protein [Streptomyces lunaelactis]|uniref:hypothetical protein n=1 Tax=Streptomyces lunaelactis TaxID=1535768 RepID=UPI001585B98F|nr:hypothetical protein [Streptomyces lunaelactis]NUK14045.1 hypothetical protein [Streptomyces lunaelactis]
MTQLLPRTYWCHRDYDGPGREQPEPRSATTPHPGRAIDWMRESVREILPELDDRPTFALAWAWLGNHQAVKTAVQELRQGRPYTFTVPTPDGRWSWTAYPICVLPVVDSCSNAPRPKRRLTPAGANGAPP